MSLETVLIVMVAVAAGTNWFSRRPAAVGPGAETPSRWLEWVTKPAVTLGLLALALIIEPADPGQRVWFVVGLVLCLVGDVALMLPTELFRTGLVAFLLGHVAFVAGFVARAELAPGWSIVVGGVLLAGCLIAGALHLLPAVRRREPGLFGPVLAYVVVIAVMAIAAWRGGRWAAPIGAATFAVSDLTLADNKFVTPRRWSPVAVMVTYHLALALLVVSLR